MKIERVGVVREYWIWLLGVLTYLDVMENSDESIISGLGDTSSNSSVSDISDSTLSAEIYLSSTEVSSKIIMDLQNKFYFEKLPLK